MLRCYYSRSAPIAPSRHSLVPPSGIQWLGKASGKVFRRRICEECALGEFASIVAVEFAERAIQR